MLVTNYNVNIFISVWKGIGFPMFVWFAISHCKYSTADSKSSFAWAWDIIIQGVLLSKVYHYPRSIIVQGLLVRTPKVHLVFLSYFDIRLLLIWKSGQATKEFSNFSLRKDDLKLELFSSQTTLLDFFPRHYLASFFQNFLQRGQHGPQNNK